MMRIQNTGKEWALRGGHLALGFVLCLGTVNSALATVNIADTPLAVSPTVPPNIMFVLDDSGSMHFEFMPDDAGANYTPYMYPQPREVYGDGDYAFECNSSVRYYVPTFEDDNFHNVWLRSSHNNKVFYDPTTEYMPWTKHDGTLMADADPTNALYNPSDSSKGGMNLTQQQTMRSHWYSGSSADNESRDCNDEHTFWPITYFVFDDAGGSDSDDIDDYDKFEITTSTPDSEEFTWEDADGDSFTRTKAEEIQNFANWFQYYRSRILAARAGIGSAFAAQGEDRRVGFGTINKGSTSIDGVDTRTIIDGVRRFEGSAREDFFAELYDRDIPNEGTPLRRALGDAGEYFARSDNRGPWGKLPGTDDPASHVECRQSFTILMTDGYWSGSAASNSGPRADTDGSTSGNMTITGPEGNSFTYSPEDPFQDSRSNTLADVAMYYWKRDLRTDLENKVPVGVKNPAFWQHMVTMGIGLGVTGSIELTSEDVKEYIENETAVAWPDPSGGDSAKIDDLLHASINGRGEFVNAANPDDFKKKFLSLLHEAGERAAQSATASATSSTVLQSDSKSFAAGFRGEDWSGTLQAFELESGGGQSATPIWDAEEKLNDAVPADRNILTHNGTNGVALSLADLSGAQAAALNHGADNANDGLGQARIDWLRGVNDNTSLRQRKKTEGEVLGGSDDLRLLGDIVSSNPQYAAKVNYGFTQLAEGGAAYRTYRGSTDYNSRVDALYVGANSGMLHGFNAETGVELFAYMPGELFQPEAGRNHAPISRLMADDYTHRHFMDGTPVVSDAYIGGAWKTILVGSMGLGGRTIFAIDVTDPSSIETTDILWEYTEADLGYGAGQPAIVPLQDGRWAAVFGNGYNSEGHDSTLYVVNLADGSLIKKITAGLGTDAAPNGLGTPYVTDWPTGGRILGRAYAGDLQGNLWRFDLSSADTDNWDVELLFQAEDDAGNPQPITAAPVGAPLPGTVGKLVVSFGTGSFFRTGDDIDHQVQSLYGLIDGGTEIERDDLVEQTIETQQSVSIALAEGGTQNYMVRRISENAIGADHKGWYMDLTFNSSNVGERVISAASFPSGLDHERVRFSTLIPEPDPCGAGRSGYIMDFLLASGGRTSESVFDLNRDEKYDNSDKVSDDVINGISMGQGEALRTIVEDDNDCVVGKNLCIKGEGSSGRQTWEQLR